MATGLDITRFLQFSGSYTRLSDLLDVPANLSPISSLFKKTYQFGTGAGQANKLYVRDFNPISGSQNLDFSGVLLDAYGELLNLTKIREILVANLSETTGQIATLSGNLLTAGQFGTVTNLIVGPQGVWHQSSPIDGFTVTATTGDTLTINPGAVTYRCAVVVVGVG